MKGTGLGLWISKGIIQKYGGTIRFRSASVAGRNITCFQIRLPDADVQGVINPNARALEAIEIAGASNGRL